MTDTVWDEAFAPLEEENLQREAATALVEAERYWPFLAGAHTRGEYLQRKGMIETSGQWSQEIHDDFDRRFATAAMQRQADEWSEGLDRIRESDDHSSLLRMIDQNDRMMTRLPDSDPSQPKLREQTDVARERLRQLQGSRKQADEYGKAVDVHAGCDHPAGVCNLVEDDENYRSDRQVEEDWKRRSGHRHAKEQGTHAPYKIEERDGSYVVVNSLGETKGTHDTKEQAREQQKALYANVPGAKEQAEKKSAAREGEQPCPKCGSRNTVLEPTSPPHAGSHDIFCMNCGYDESGSFDALASLDSLSLTEQDVIEAEQVLAQTSQSKQAEFFRTRTPRRNRPKGPDADLPQQDQPGPGERGARPADPAVQQGDRQNRPPRDDEDEQKADRQSSPRMAGVGYGMEDPEYAAGFKAGYSDGQQLGRFNLQNMPGTTESFAAGYYEGYDAATDPDGLSGMGSRKQSAEAPENLYGTEEPDDQLAEAPRTEPKTTRPRGHPTNQPDPTYVLPSKGEEPEEPLSGEAFLRPTQAQRKRASTRHRMQAKIAQRVQQDNPHMSTEAAHDLASQVLDRHPEMMQ